MAHQITVKGQVTIPKRGREYLGIVRGSGVMKLLRGYSEVANDPGFRKSQK